MIDTQQIPSARRFRAPKHLAEMPCQHCYHPLGFGALVMTCEACGAQHHASCWDEQAGCATVDCFNAPFKELPVDDATVGVSEGKCRWCRSPKTYLEAYCPQCFRDDDRIYHGEKTLVPEAKTALIQAIFGIFVLQIILLPLAVRNAMAAKRTIDGDPSYYRGREMANAALWIAIIVGILVVLGLIGKLST
jgi:Zn finger protein HypA/HybF involved in hydrogenase expression